MDNNSLKAVLSCFCNSELKTCTKQVVTTHFSQTDPVLLIQMLSYIRLYVFQF